jgi:hypothetical protein
MTVIPFGIKEVMRSLQDPVRQLCDQAATEVDPQRLIELTKKICEAIDTQLGPTKKPSVQKRGGAA